MEDLIKIAEVPAEYPFSRRTIERWREKGLLSTFRQGEKRVLVSRAELDALMAKKEKVGVGRTDEEARNEGFNLESGGKGSHFSSDEKNINVKKRKSKKNENQRSEK